MGIDEINLEILREIGNISSSLSPSVLSPIYSSDRAEESTRVNYRPVLMHGEGFMHYLRYVVYAQCSYLHKK